MDIPPNLQQNLPSKYSPLGAQLAKLARAQKTVGEVAPMVRIPLIIIIAAHGGVLSGN